MKVQQGRRAAKASGQCWLATTKFRPQLLQPDFPLIGLSDMVQADPPMEIPADVRLVVLGHELTEDAVRRRLGDHRPYRFSFEDLTADLDVAVHQRIRKFAQSNILIPFGFALWRARGAPVPAYFVSYITEVLTGRMATANA